MIEPSAIYSCRLDPTQLSAEFIFRACLRVRRSPSAAASEHQDEPDGRHFKQADVCSGCFENRSLGGRDGGRLPTVFNLAATLLAFRAGDKEMRDPCVLSHSLNVEFRRYPSTPVQQFTCFFVFFLYRTLELHFSLC